MTAYKVGEIINVVIYDPHEARSYLLGFYAENDADALQKAKDKVSGWGHVVKRTSALQPYQRVEGNRVKQTSNWYY